MNEEKRFKWASRWENIWLGLFLVALAFIPIIDRLCPVFISPLNLPDNLSKAIPLIQLLLLLIGAFNILGGWLRSYPPKKKHPSKYKCTNKDALIAQYKECYEYLRQHDKFVWQIPSITAVINGALIIGALKYIPETGKYLFAKQVLIGIGIILTVTLTIAIIKHRYFAEIEEETLTEIENALELKNIQRRTHREVGRVYWVPKSPGLRAVSAFWFFLLSMFLILCLLVWLFVELDKFVIN